VRLPVLDVPDSYAGREVVLGVRPECITEPDRRLGDDALLLDASVEMTEPTGSETIVLLRLAGLETLARIAPDVKLKAGESARFAVDTRKLCLFDAATERLIG
jgi:multiple sugar transport system ATP-binding protein